jgi:hypothetical protein
MKWFRHWLKKLVSQAVDEENVKNNAMQPKQTVVGCDDDLGEKQLRFTIHFGQGGIVVQQYHYDHQKDRSFKKLLIIPEDADYAEVIGQHVAMEIMRL